MSALSSLCRAAIFSLAAVHSASWATTVTFQTATPGTFTSHSEGGISVVATGGPWVVYQWIGGPERDIHFTNQAGSGPLTASVEITSALGLFTFDSVDLYSSVTPIPYTIVGYSGVEQSFLLSGQIPNTLGSFYRLQNSFSDSRISSLRISLTNPAISCCSNPMAIDNITTSHVSAVPELPTSLLMSAALALMLVLNGARHIAHGRRDA